MRQSTRTFAMALILGLGLMQQWAAADVIKVSLVPSKKTGMAPFPVFFDATGTQVSSGEISNAEFFWDFGDLSSRHSRASGYAVAHVFDKPGFYTVKLVVKDVTGLPVVTSTQITVSPFAGATYYVSSSAGNDQNNGLSEQTPFKTLPHALSKMDSALSGGPSAVRILFRRGDTFTTDGFSFLRRTGSPATLAAYGSGPKPVIQATTKNDVVLNFMADIIGFRVIDLDFRGNYDFSSRSGPGQTLVSLGERSSDFLVYRCEFRRAMGGFSMAGGYGLSEVYVVDSVFNEFGYAAGYVAGARLAVIGNTMMKSATRHVLRIWNVDRGFISRNVLHYPSVYQAGGLALKIHAVRGPARYVVVSENDLKGGQYVASLAPQNASAVEYIDHVVFEKNILRNDATTSLGLAITANDVVIRNNEFIVDSTGKTGLCSAMSLISHQVLPGSKRIHIYNNTCSDLRKGAEFNFLRIGTSSAADVHIRNNIVYAPEASLQSLAFYFVNPLSGLTADYNIWHMPKTQARGPAVGPTAYSWAEWQKAGQDVHSKPDDPLLVDPAHENLRLSTGSPAIDAGDSVKGIFEAIDSERRPFGSATDIGAYEAVTAANSSRFVLVATPNDPAPGSRVQLSINAKNLASRPYQMALAFATHPAIRIRREISIPLTADALFILSSLNLPGIGLQNFMGTLDGSGAGAGSVTIPNSPVLRGVVFYAAAVVKQNGYFITDSSNPVQITVK